MSHNIPQGGQGDMGSTSGASKDQKCYFPCKICKILNIRRLLITIAKRLCREYGHIEAGHEYHRLVSYSLYVFVLYFFL